MIFDYFKIAVRNLFRRRLRSWLTVIGIFIGIMAVVALLSLSQGMQDALLSEFKKMGTNRIIITPGGAEMGPIGGLVAATEFSEDDYNAIKNVRGVEVSSSVYMETAYIYYNRERKQEMVWGFPFTSDRMDFYEGESMFEIEEGRLLRPGDKYKVMIGYDTAHELFDDDIKIGKTILINKRPFEVVGIHAKKGGLSGDSSIRIPKEAAREIFGEPKKVNAIFLRVREDFNVNDVAERVKHKLGKYRDVKSGEEDFTIQTSEEIINTFNQILGIVQAILVGIAAISLLVGGIGIMNTMYTSVVERTREIGIMKSVGAKNSSIMLIFLIESGLLGFFGGFIGLILGLGISKVSEMIAINMGIDSLHAYMGSPLIIGALSFAFIIGAVSGTLPALHASKLNPVDALRK